MNTNIPIQYGSASQSFTGEEIVKNFQTKESFVAWGKDICFPGLDAERREKAMADSWDIIQKVMVAQPAEVPAPAQPETPVQDPPKEAE